MFLSSKDETYPTFQQFSRLFKNKMNLIFFPFEVIMEESLKILFLKSIVRNMASRTTSRLLELHNKMGCGA